MPRAATTEHNDNVVLVSRHRTVTRSQLKMDVARPAAPSAASHRCSAASRPRTSPPTHTTLVSHLRQPRLREPLAVGPLCRRPGLHRVHCIPVPEEERSLAGGRHRAPGPCEGLIESKDSGESATRWSNHAGWENSNHAPLGRSSTARTGTNESCEGKYVELVAVRGSLAL